jgi:hypothetical protein
MSPSESKKRQRLGLPRFTVGDAVMANSHAPGNYRDRRGHVTEVAADGTECRIEFEDGLRPTTGYLPARWLDH